MSALVYLHGFASGPASVKARFLAPRLEGAGYAVSVPDLNLPSFEGLTLSRVIEALDAALPEAGGVVVGSSMGAYAAALYATQRPERVRALVLMAPALNLAGLIEGRYAEALPAWERSGRAPVEHPYLGEAELAWGFVEDARAWAACPVAPRCPTLILHGRHDEEVPFSGSEAMAARLPGLRLVPFDDGHRLDADLEGLWAAVEAFLGEAAPVG